MKRAKTKNKIAKISIFSFVLSFFLYAFFLVSVLQLGVHIDKKRTRANTLEAELATLEGRYFSSVEESSVFGEEDEVKKVPVFYVNTTQEKKFVYLDASQRR